MLTFQVLTRLQERPKASEILDLPVSTARQLDKKLMLTNQISLRAKMQQRDHGELHSQGMRS